MMKRFKLDPNNLPEMTPAQLKRLDEMPIDFSDIPELGEDFFKNARRVNEPLSKSQLTIRLDADVLAWLKSNGRGYQTRINRILRAAMESKPSRRARSTTSAPKKNGRTRSASRPT